MPLHFQPNQPVVVHLPGGDFKGAIVGPGQNTDEWIVKITESDNPLEETRKGAEGRGKHV